MWDGTPMSNGYIFISYRRDDSAGYARAIYDQLVQHFSRERIFMDVDAIEPGFPFDEAIERAVGQCEILLAMIGRRWMEQQAGAGPRINDPKDFVRLEIAAALSRNIRVIPVLLDGASMPAEEALPEPLRALARRNALEVSNSRFKSDMERLLGAVSKALGESNTSRGKQDLRTRKSMLYWLAGGLAVVVLFSSLLFDYSPTTNRSLSQSSPTLMVETGEPLAPPVNGPSKPIPGTSSSFSELGPKPPAAGEQPLTQQPISREARKPVELADLVAGIYYGDVISDSKGSSRSDVTVTITKMNKRKVRITSDYERLGTVEIDLTKVGNTIQSVGGSTTLLLLELEKNPPRLDYNPNGEVAYSGQRQ